MYVLYTRASAGGERDARTEEDEDEDEERKRASKRHRFIVGEACRGHRSGSQRLRKREKQMGKKEGLENQEREGRGEGRARVRIMRKET